MEIIPSINTESLEEFDKKIALAKSFTQRIHLDIADGVFVQHRTIRGYDKLKESDGTMQFEVHLMTQRPIDDMHLWFLTSADRFIVHVETNHVLHQIIETAKLNNREIGLAINPQTYSDRLEEFLETLDFVHFMTVEPGPNGGSFIDSVLGKIAAFHEQYPEIPISVDGGVNPSNSSRLVIAGASRLISGSFIFNSPNPASAFEELKNLSAVN